MNKIGIRMRTWIGVGYIAIGIIYFISMIMDKNKGFIFKLLPVLYFWSGFMLIRSGILLKKKKIRK